MTILNMEITASESPQTVHMPIEGKYYAIKNTGESDILASSYVANPTEGADDVIKIPSGSVAVIPVKDGNLYVSAEEDGTYSVSIQDDKVIPWGGGTGSGGGSGDNTHYKGTTTTPLENGSTTNPIVIDGKSYTAVFGDVVVYGYTEFVFDGTAWSEFGRPFDTTPTQGSTNAVTSDGVYRNTAGRKYFVNGELRGETFNGTNTASGSYSHAEGYSTTASGWAAHAEGQNTTASAPNSHAGGIGTIASRAACTVIGQYNTADTSGTAHLLIVGNGKATNARSNIVEVNATSMNVNGDIKINNVAIPTPYTTMPTITESMLGQIAMYVGATGGGYIQGGFYIASTDGAAEPTYSWVQIGGGTLGLEEVVLWENEGKTNPQTITLSDRFSNYDEIYFAPGYTADESGSRGTRAAGSIYLSALFADASDTNRQYLSVSGVTQGTPEFCDFYYDGNVTLYTSTNREVFVKKIIGRRYTRVNPTGYRQTVLWENEDTTNPQTITLSEAITNFDEIRVVAHQNAEGNNLLETSFTVSEIGSQSMVLYALLSNYGTYSLANSNTLTKILEDGSQGFYVYKILGIKY